MSSKSKKSKELKRQFKERGRNFTSFDDAFEPKNKFEGNENTKKIVKENGSEKPKIDPQIFDFVKSNEKTNIFTMEISLTNRGIPVVTEYVTENKSRFVIFTSGTFKKPIWIPKDKICKNGVQALIPVAVKNLIVDFDKETNIISVYKITHINIKTKSISAFLYNKFVDGGWTKEIFESLAPIEEYAKRKIEDKSFVCFNLSTENEDDKANEK